MNVDETARAVHFSSLVLDAHSDSLARTAMQGDDLGTETGRGQMDLPRMRDGHITAQFFAVGSSPEHLHTGRSIHEVLRQIDALKELCARYPEQIEQAYTASDVRRIVEDGKVAAILCLEGGHAIEDDLSVLRIYHELGIRYHGLTWNNTHGWADGILDEPQHDGLTDFGREVVRETERLGILVDVSHSAVSTFWDVMDVVTKPLIASHSSALALCSHPRNMNDDQIRAVADNNGIVCVNFESRFISQRYLNEYDELYAPKDAEEAELRSKHASNPKILGRVLKEVEAQYRQRRVDQLELPHFSEIADHIDHISSVAGVNHVGLGSDFDGCIPPAGMEDCTSMPKLTQELLNRGYSDLDVRKVLGENMLRVLAQATGE